MRVQFNNICAGKTVRGGKIYCQTLVNQITRGVRQITKVCVAGGEFRFVYEFGKNIALIVARYANYRNAGFTMPR